MSARISFASAPQAIRRVLGGCVACCVMVQSAPFMAVPAAPRMPDDQGLKASAKSPELYPITAPEAARTLRAPRRFIAGLRQREVAGEKGESPLAGPAPIVAYSAASGRRSSRLRQRSTHWAVS